MAVYTQVSAEALAAFLTRYDHGALVSAKGIAEGVENSNYMVDTTAGRYILTLYEKRVAAGDLPFFMAMLDHLAADGNLVPRAFADRDRLRCAVDQAFVALDAPIAGATEIAIFPPVTGG